MDCEVVVSENGLRAGADQANIDAVMAAFYSGKATGNGYSGHEPASYFKTLIYSQQTPLKQRLNEWFEMHGVKSDTKKLCSTNAAML